MAARGLLAAQSFESMLFQSSRLFARLVAAGGWLYQGNTEHLLNSLYEIHAGRLFATRFPSALPSGRGDGGGGLVGKSPLILC